MKQMTITEYKTALQHGFDVSNIVSAKQLRTCQAWVLTDRFGVKWLQSYHTIVSKAVNGIITHLGKWSVTTSRQQTWFSSAI